MRTSLALLASSALLLARPAGAQAPHPLTVEDLIAFDRISGAAVSPDGRRVVFTVSSLDLEANRRRTDLYLASVAGPPASARRFTAHDSARAAAFSADGRWVYFLSARGGSSQVWRIAADGGEAEPVTRLGLDVGSFRLSPDGSRLVVSVEVFPACGDLECTRKRLAEVAARKASGRIYDHLLFRHWDAWSDGRRAHLIALPADGSGAPVDLMAGMDADCPSKPFGGEDEYTFAPDGRSLVLSARDVGSAEAWSTNFDLFSVPVDGSARPRNLTAANPAWDTHPLHSPDGKALLYLRTTRPGYESDRRHLVLRDLASGRERELAAGWDRSPDEVLWSRDGRTLFAVADDVGHRGLFAIEVGSGRVRPLIDHGHVAGPRLAGGEILVSLDSFAGPAELFRLRPDGGGLTPVTALNAARLATVQLGKAEPLSFSGAGGDTVHGYVVLPVPGAGKADGGAGGRVPVALLIHGGPQGSFSDNFHYRWNPQIYAAAGYAAVLVDFHGSTGYGQAFTDAIRDDWGGRPLVDLQKGLEAALARFPQLDGERVCALGASYGGYLVNWIAGQWPDRFRCLVSHDGNLDEKMAYFDTEELWFPEWEHGGTPWDNPSGYARQNPVDFVKHWKTPTLVIHGGRDYRVVDTQGMSTFTALQRRGVQSRFLYFPDENHWVLKPQNSVLWHHTVLEWLERHTARTAPAAAAAPAR